MVSITVKISVVATLLFLFQVLLVNSLVIRRTSAHSYHKLQSKLHSTYKNDNDVKTTEQTENWWDKLMFWKQFDSNSNQNNNKKNENEMLQQKKTKPTNGVLIFGSTGRTGSLIVEELIKNNNYDIILAGNNGTKVNQMFNNYNTKLNNFFIYENIDVTNDTSLLSNQELFTGVKHIISCLGPSFGNPLYNSENVDYYGCLNIINAYQTYLSNNQVDSNSDSDNVMVIDLQESTKDLSQWRRVDDVIMGGKSSSQWSTTDGQENDFARWSGTTNTNGGGFCGTLATLSKPLMINKHDGIEITVRGDGNRYKVSIPTCYFSFPMLLLY